MLKNVLCAKSYGIEYDLSQKEILSMVSSKEKAEKFLNLPSSRKKLSKGYDTLFEFYIDDKLTYVLGKEGCKLPKGIKGFLEELSKELQSMISLSTGSLSSVDIVDDSGDSVIVMVLFDDDMMPPGVLNFSKAELCEASSGVCKSLYEFINTVSAYFKNIQISDISIRPDIYGYSFSSIGYNCCTVLCMNSTINEGEYSVAFYLKCEK